MHGMKLILVQHGEAQPKEVDPERPLSDKGREDIRRLADLLHRASIEPGEIRHSGKRRARETAALLAEKLTPGRDPVISSGLRPKDPPGALAETLASRPVNLMLVSHLPFVERLASLLLTGSEEGLSIDFHPGTAMALECREEGVWDLLWLVNPVHLLP